MAKKASKQKGSSEKDGGLILVDVHGVQTCVRSSFIPPLKSKITVKNWVYPVDELTVIGHKWILDDNSSELMPHVLTSPPSRPSPAKTKK